MRLTAFLLTAAVLQVSARGSAQITLAEKNAPLAQVLQSVKQQSGYDLFYDEDLVKQKGKPVDIDVRNVTVEKALDLIFRGQALTYTLAGRIISVKERETPVPLPAAVPPPNDIHGRVTDSLGNPLAGASVTVKGSKRGTSTDVRGEFELKNVGEEAVLIISYTGFISREIRVAGNPELQSGRLRVMLAHGNSSLDNVQVIAYGSTTQRLSTGDVTTVTSKEIEEQPVANPLLALEGRVPGLVVTQSSGFAGSGVTVQVQGQNTISYAVGTDPLYVIDGVPYPSQLLYSLSLIQGTSTSNGGPNQAGFPAGGGSSLSFINPNDIESITVLKDADATAIYGSRAANGAILITTKKGKVGKTKGDINIQNGWGHIMRELPLLNTSEYLEMRHEAFANDGLTPSPGYDYDLTYWDTTRYTDWQKTLIGGTAQYTDAEASISGGTANTQFLVGTGYHSETTVLPGNFADQKGSLHFNLNSISPDQKFKFQLTGSYQLDDNHLLNTDLTQEAMRIAPDAPNIRNADGSLNWDQLNGNSTWLNPLAYLYNTFSNKTNNLTSNVLLSYQVLRGLEVKSSFGYNNLQSDQVLLFPLISSAPEIRSFTLRNAQFENNNINSWIVEPQIDYKSRVASGNLDALVGTTIQQNNSSSQQQYASGQSSDLLLREINSAPDIAAISGYSTYKYNALFGRLSYNWQDKYLLNLSARRDGSSRFGPQNQFHDFWSVGAGWIFSNSSFFKDDLPFLSFGKLRSSYGTTGNDQIGDYQFLSLYNVIYNGGVPYQGVTGLKPTNLANPYLAWEETRKLQVGIDLGLLKDRILGTAVYYQNRSSNLLTPYTLPWVTGFSSIEKNFPALVQNSGWELSLNTKNVITRDFTWTSSFNFTTAKNKLLKFASLAESSYADQLEIGHPVTSEKLFHFLGVNPASGLWQVADNKGNPTTTPNIETDRTVVKSTAPSLYGGLQNSLSYKNLKLDFLFQFVKQNAGNYLFGDDNAGFFYSGAYASDGNEPRTVLNRWQKPGDVALYEKFSTAYGNSSTSNAALSDAAFSDASYIRLKNVALSWQLPKKWGEKSPFLNGRLYIQGQNLLTITKYKGLDPETKSSVTLPPLRVITMGIQVTP